MLRNELLNKLLNMNTSVRAITDELNQFGWDSNEQPVNLTRQHILNVLLNYQKGTVILPQNTGHQLYAAHWNSSGV